MPCTSYLTYVDESGDSGLVNSPTDFYVLAGLVVHELRWQSALSQIVAFRRRVRAQFGFPVRDEIHASELVNTPGRHANIRKGDRLRIVREFAHELGQIPDIDMLVVIVDKRSKTPGYDVFEVAWQALIQRLENTLSHSNFRGPNNPIEFGMLFPDNTDGRKLRQLVRRLRHYNPVPNQPQYGPGYRNMPVTHIIEDPNLRDSADSYFIQAADTAAWLVHQHLRPNSYMRQRGRRNTVRVLDPIFCRTASRSDPRGWVRL